MKKLFGFLIFIIILVFVYNLDYGNKVFLVETPVKIFIDSNNNLIFDEKEPIIIKDLFYINKDTDYEKFPELKTLTDEQRFFLEYMANDTARKIINHRYVKVQQDDILVNNKSYKQLLLNSKYFFDNSKSSQQRFLDNIKSINLDEYVILNLKNKKYHKLNCESGRKSAKYKIVKLETVKNSAEACKACHLPAFKTQPKEQNQVKQTAKINEEFSLTDITVFFIDLNKTFKPDNSCSTAACRALKKEIDNAKTSIDFAIYGINNQPQILQALINAHKRGVRIRRVYDYSNKKYYEDNDKLDNIITTFKTDEEYDKANSSALMHNKYFIFDNQKVWSGTANISSTDLSGFNANYAVLINSKAIAEKYLADFDQMYSGTFHKGKTSPKSEFIQINPETKVKALFSPQDNIIDTEVLPLLKSAQKYIYIPAFFITHKKIEEVLIAAKNKNVEVKVITDATNAHTNYSIHKNLRKAGIKVKTENYAGKMHAKTIIIDDKYTIIGSMNFTRSGNSKNDENVLIIDSGKIAAFMRSTFLYLWNKIPVKYETFDPKAESTESQGSCSDNIDNDFDDKIDSDDEGCFIKKN